MQDLSMNPQKLAGQCAKLKCCLNFEIDAYAEASKKLPPKDVVLNTKDQDYYHFKVDILSRMVTYSSDPKMAVNLVTIPASRAFEIIALNKQGVKPDQLETEKNEEPERPEFIDLTDQDDLTRFDKARRKKKGKKQGQDQNHPREKEKQPDRQSDNRPKQGANKPNQQKQGQPQQKGSQQKQKGQHKQELPQNHPQGQPKQSEEKSQGDPNGQPKQSQQRRKQKAKPQERNSQQKHQKTNASGPSSEKKQ